MSIDFTDIFDVYSLRNQVEGEPNMELTQTFKNRLRWLCRSAFPDSPGYGGRTEVSYIWTETYRKFQWLIGSDQLPGHTAIATRDKLEGFLDRCSDEHFLDFIEYFFRSTRMSDSKIEISKFVNDINVFFQVDNLPYFLTSPVISSKVQAGIAENESSSLSHDGEMNQYPQIIRRENFALHNSAIGPALTFLI